MSLYDIILTIIFVCFIIAMLTYMVWDLKLSKKDEETLKLKEIEKNNKLKKIQEDLELAKTMINNGAKVYINGLEVDGTKIIINNYHIDFVEDYIILSS